MKKTILALVGIICLFAFRFAPLFPRMLKMPTGKRLTRRSAASLPSPTTFAATASPAATSP